MVILSPGHVRKLSVLWWLKDNHFGHKHEWGKKRWSDTYYSLEKSELTLNLDNGKVTILIITYFKTLISVDWIIFN